MIVTAHLLPARKETKTVTLRDGARVEELIRSLGLYPDAWIATRDGVPLPLDEPLEDDDEIRLIAVVSGG